jgi:hypothetical protein
MLSVSSASFSARTAAALDSIVVVLGNAALLRGSPLRVGVGDAADMAQKVRRDGGWLALVFGNDIL